MLSPIEQIRSATIVGAEVLRRPGQLGVVNSGAFADLIVVDGNPLDDIGVLAEQGHTLPLIIANGRVVKDEL